MNNSGARRDHAKVIQALFGPADKAVTLSVTAKIKLQVIFQRRGGGIAFDNHRMIDSQYCRNARIDRRGIAAQLGC